MFSKFHYHPLPYYIGLYKKLPWNRIYMQKHPCRLRDVCSWYNGTFTVYCHLTNRQDIPENMDRPSSQHVTLGQFPMKIYIAPCVAHQRRLINLVPKRVALLLYPTVIAANIYSVHRARVASCFASSVLSLIVNRTVQLILYTQQHTLLLYGACNISSTVIITSGRSM